ncbi:hypothetical protein K2173_012081 [Erythroxylum novogranatense]|uniref:NAC domain-containing protein n=1 Tax=Erythroxylum novogranatense TaxID=1862640 RepID=A0AAV8TGL5_9ROSI|nr:hypothetical protein K2173_012081 [Erythroxylum novogranatense]
MGGVNNLPPGFIFSPTDEELVLQFLYPKASLLPCQPDIIPVLDHCHPWELDGKALSSENQWYFFCRMMEHKETGSGYWKELEIEKPVMSGAGGKVGLKKYFVYCIGEPEQGVETSWMMQEFRLDGTSFSSSSSSSSSSGHKRSKKLERSKWVLCRVYQRKASPRQSFGCGDDDDDCRTELSFLDEVFLSILDDDDLDGVKLTN